jgi:hypothetical protein
MPNEPEPWLRSAPWTLGPTVLASFGREPQRFDSADFARPATSRETIGFVRRLRFDSRAAVVGFVRFARLRLIRDRSLLGKKRKVEMPKSAKEIIELAARGVLFNSGNQRTMIAEVLAGRYSWD